MRPAYLGWVGEDAWGEQLRRELGAKGVDVSHVHGKPGSTALTFVELHGSDRVLGDYAEGVMSDFYLSEQDLAWIGQFVGHAIEGRRPAFLTNVVQLLIGPAWLLSKLYRKLGLSW